MGSSSKIHGVWSVLQAPAAAQESRCLDFVRGENKCNHLSRTICNPPGELRHQSRDNFRISTEQHSSRGTGFAQKSAKSCCQGEGKGHCTPPALPGLQLHPFTSHKPHFSCQDFTQLSAFDIVNQACQEPCNS